MTFSKQIHNTTEYSFQSYFLERPYDHEYRDNIVLLCDDKQPIRIAFKQLAISVHNHGM